MKRVDERNPGKVTDSKHESETVRGDIHGGEDGGLRIAVKITHKEAE